MDAELGRRGGRDQSVQSTGSRGIICSLRNPRPERAVGSPRPAGRRELTSAPASGPRAQGRSLREMLGALRGQAVTSGSGLETWKLWGQNTWGSSSSTATELNLSALPSEPRLGRPPSWPLLGPYDGPGRPPCHPPAALHSRLLLPQTDTYLPRAVCPDCPDPSRLDSSHRLLTYYPERQTRGSGVTLQKRGVEGEGPRSVSHRELGVICSDKGFPGPQDNPQRERWGEEAHTCCVSPHGSQVGTVGQERGERVSSGHLLRDRPFI